MWALFELHRAPETLRRAHEELRTAGPDATLIELLYLDAVCQETSRLHPPVPNVLRRLTGSFTLRGVRLTAGDSIGVAVGLSHFYPEAFTDPPRLQPERSPDREYRPFEFAPSVAVIDAASGPHSRTTNCGLHWQYC